MKTGGVKKGEQPGEGERKDAVDEADGKPTYRERVVESLWGTGGRGVHHVLFIRSRRNRSR